MPAFAQSSPDAERPCAPIVAEALVPAGIVTCATTAASVGPLSGTIQNTAPLSTESAVVDVHESQSIPIEEIAPAASPSVMPTVSHESTAAVAETAMNAGLTPPVLAPKGVLSWYAA
eukprot:COSAG02_NODE_36860_length_449_cov_1.180000_2_plen_116_part_01